MKSSDCEAVNSERLYLTQVILGQCYMEVLISLSGYLPPVTHPSAFCEPVLSGKKPNMVISLPVEG